MLSTALSLSHTVLEGGGMHTYEPIMHLCNLHMRKLNPSAQTVALTFSKWKLKCSRLLSHHKLVWINWERGNTNKMLWRGYVWEEWFFLWGLNKDTGQPKTLTYQWDQDMFPVTLKSSTTAKWHSMVIYCVTTEPPDSKGRPAIKLIC